MLTEVLCVVIALWSNTVPLHFWDHRNKTDVGIRNRTLPGMAIFGTVFDLDGNSCVKYLHRTVYEFLVTRLYSSDPIANQVLLAIFGLHIYMKPFAWISSKESRVMRWLVAISHVISIMFGAVLYMMQYYSDRNCADQHASESCSSHHSSCVWRKSTSSCEQTASLQFVMSGVVSAVLVGSVFSALCAYLLEHVLAKYPECVSDSERGNDVDVLAIQGEDHCRPSSCAEEVESLFERILKDEESKRTPTSPEKGPGTNDSLRPPATLSPPRASEVTRIPVAVGVWKYIPVEEEASSAMTVMGIASDGGLVPLCPSENLFFDNREQLLCALVAKARVRSQWVCRHLLDVEPYLGESRRDRVGYGSSENATRTNIGHIVPLLYLHYIVDVLPPVMRCFVEDKMLAVNCSRPSSVSAWRWSAGLAVYLSLQLAMLVTIFVWAGRVDSGQGGTRRSEEQHWWWVIVFSLFFDAMGGVVAVCVLHVLGMSAIQPFLRRCARLLDQQQQRLQQGEMPGGSEEREARRAMLGNRSVPAIPHSSNDDCKSDPAIAGNRRDPESCDFLPVGSELCDSSTVTFPHNYPPMISHHLLSSCRASRRIGSLVGSPDVLRHIPDEDFLSVTTGAARGGKPKQHGLVESAELFLYSRFPSHAQDVVSCVSFTCQKSAACFFCLLLSAFVFLNSAILQVSPYLLGSFYVIGSLAVFFLANSIHYGEEEEEGHNGTTSASSNWTETWRENSGPVVGGQGAEDLSRANAWEDKPSVSESGVSGIRDKEGSANDDGDGDDDEVY